MSLKLSPTRLSLGVFFLVLSSVFVSQSPMGLCDEPMPRGHFTLTDVDIYAINRVKQENGRIAYVKSEDLNHTVRFDFKTLFTVAEDSKQKPFKILNQIVKEKSSITLDKAIMFMGKEVPAGENLRKYNAPEFNPPTKKKPIPFPVVRMPKLNPLGIGSIRVSDKFSFPNDVYTFKFHWETNDGTVFEKELTVTVNVESKEQANQKSAAADEAKPDAKAKEMATEEPAEKVQTTEKAEKTEMTEPENANEQLKKEN